jgi:hypothetical protein
MNKILLLIVFFSCCNFLQAQINLEEKIKQKIEQQDFNTTRTNKERNNLDNNKKSAKPASAPTPPASEAAPEEMEMSSPNKPAETYVFDDYLAYKIESNKKVDTIRYYFGATAVMTMIDGNQTAIMDIPNKLMIMLNDEDMTAMVISTAMMEKYAQNANQNAAPSNPPVKTGKSKKILGYSCFEYKMENEKKEVQYFWICETIEINYSALASFTKDELTKKVASSTKGVMLEAFLYNEKGELETHMIATEYLHSKTEKSLKAYTIQQF